MYIYIVHVLSPEFGKLVFLMRYFNVTSVSFMEIQFHVKIRAPCLPAITIIIIIILQLNIILQFLILLRKLFSPLVSSLEKRAEKDRNEIRGQIARWGYFRWNGRMRGFSQQWPAKFIMVESDSNGSEIWGKKNMRSRSRFLSFLDIIEIVSDAYKYFPIS